MNLSLGIRLHPFEMAKHAGFVKSSFGRSLRDLGTVPPLYIRQHVYQLDRSLRSGLGVTVVATPIIDPDTLLGWAHYDAGSLIYAYTIADCRRFGVASTLAGAFYTDGKVPVVYWTVLAQDVRDHGYPIEHDFDEFMRRSKLAEKSTLRYYETIAHERTP